jgi:hypothetical protein
MREINKLLGINKKNASLLHSSISYNLFKQAKIKVSLLSSN